MTKALTDSYWAQVPAKDQFLPNPDLTALLAMAAKNEPAPSPSPRPPWSCRARPT